MTPFYPHRLKQSLKTAALTGTFLGIWWLIPLNTPSAFANLKESPKTVVDEVWQIIHNNYIHPDFNQDEWEAIREELLERNYQSKQEAYEAIRDAIDELADSHTRFLEPEEFEELSRQTAGEVSGIGIQLTMDSDHQTLKVVDIVDDSPAEKAGIQPGDKIVSIDGRPSSLLNVEQASDLMRGESGTKVKLVLSRSGFGQFERTLTRHEIEIPRVTYKLREIDNMQVGYIQVEEFSSHTTEQMRDALTELSQKNAEAFVLDLRNNPGGLLEASINIADLFLEQGTIVSTVERGNGKRSFEADPGMITDKPLAVLVNENSASASEILVGALKDNDRAVIVGSQTYGKGTIQAVRSLADGSGIAVTVARYHLPDGDLIEKEGIKPDVKSRLPRQDKVRLSSNPKLQGTQDDPQFSRAITILKKQLNQPALNANSEDE